MTTLTTKDAVRLLKDIFETDKYKSKTEKTDKVREFVHTYGLRVLERVCEHHYNEVFPDWFEDFVISEWKPKPFKKRRVKWIPK